MSRPTHTKRGQRYLGDDVSMVVHDLERAHGACEIDEIIDEGRGVRFEPDSLEQAELEHFKPCYRCINAY